MHFYIFSLKGFLHAQSIQCVPDCSRFCGLAFLGQLPIGRYIPGRAGRILRSDRVVLGCVLCYGFDHSMGFGQVKGKAR
jgi:hypothetical protein